MSSSSGNLAVTLLVKIPLIITGALVFMIASMLWTGYVFTILWEWFVANTFGLPTISVGLAAGLGSFIRFVTYDFNALIDSTMNRSDDDGDGLKRRIVTVILAFVVPLIFLVFGWFIHTFLV